MKKNIVLLLTLSIMLLTLANISLAASLKKTFGMVKEISKDKIVLMQYVRNQPVNIAYSIDDETRYQKAESFKDLLINDGVKIIYIDTGEEKIARFIILENPAPEHGGISLDNYQAPPERTYIPDY